MNKTGNERFLPSIIDMTITQNGHKRVLVEKFCLPGNFTLQN